MDGSLRTTSATALLHVGLLTVAYLVAGKLGLAAASVHPSATVVWAPAGIALAALLVLGARTWPGIFLGALLVNLTTAGSVPTSLGIAAGNTLEGLVGASLVTRFANGRQAFDRMRDVFTYAAFAGMGSTMVSATVGVTSLALGGYADRADSGAIWLTWWLGDMGGVLLVAPTLILWSRPAVRWKRDQALELALALVALVLVGQVVFGGLLSLPVKQYPLQFLSIPVLVWVAFRFGPRETAVTLLLLCGMAVWGTLRGLGPFAGDATGAALLFLQAFMNLLAVMALALAAGVAERRRAEETLRESEERYRLMVEGVADYAIMMLDPDGRVTSWNAGVQRLKGYRADEILGRHFSRFYLPEDAQRGKPEQELAAAKTEGRFEDEGWRIRKDGTRFWANVVITAVRDEAGTLRGFSKVTRDLTQRKRVEERVRLVMEAAPTGMLLVDHAGTILLVNAQIEKLFGYGRNELLGQPIEGLVPARFRGQHPGHRQGFYAAPGPRAMGVGRDLYALRKDGSEFPVEIGLTPIETEEGVQVLASIVDITERKRAEEAIRSSEERFRSVAESAQDAIVSADARGTIVYWNRGAHTMFGYRAEDVLGQPLTRLMPDRYREAHRRGVERIRTTGEAHVVGKTVELHGLTRDGMEFPLELSLTMWRMGGDTFYSGIMRDITERKRAEEALKRANDELERRVQERTEALSRSNAELEQFAYAASHDLQEPLRMVAGYTQLLARRYKGRLDRAADEFLAYAVDGAVRMQELIRNLLAYSRVGTQSVTFEATDCETVFALTVKNLQSVITETKAAVTHDPLPTVTADGQQLEQVFQNLIGNALKFRGQATPCVHVSARRQDGDWAFSVRDNGIGLDPKQADRIFIIFQRLHSRTEYPGNGIGLAMCKKIVERHGGRIWVESQPGQGATFFFTLPSKKEQGS